VILPPDTTLQGFVNSWREWKPHRYLNIKGNLFEIKKILIMGILNVTPDSFYDGGRYFELETAIQRAKKLIEEGADIIDVGGVSTRPGSEPPPQEEELRRVLPVVKAIVNEFPDVLVSVDTFRWKVAEECLKAGAHIINDISGGDIEPDILRVVASWGAPYVVMHIRGIPKNMQEYAQYVDTTGEVLIELLKKVDRALKHGIKDIIIDPGFGFAKTPLQNWEMLYNLDVFNWVRYPLLVGISRKSMIYRILNITPDDALYGTLFANVIAIVKGADILRVHDPLPIKHVLTLIDKAWRG